MFSIVYALLSVSICTRNFTSRMEMVEHINSLDDTLWTAGVNKRFEGLPIGSVKDLCGVKPESERIVRENAVFVHGRTNNGLEVPASFDSVEKWPACSNVIGDIRDQSNCGCCWAFGSAEAASDRLCIANIEKGSNTSKIMVPLSAQSLCFCASDDGCNGGDVFTPWSHIQTQGLVTGGQVDGTGPFGTGYCSDFTLPHCHHHGPQGKDPYPAEGKPGCMSQKSAKCPTKCDASAQAPHNQYGSDKYTFSGLIMSYRDEESIQEAIMTAGPVEAAFIVYSDFANYVSGIYHHVTGEVEGGHAIRIVGWGSEAGVKYWKVANSWNRYWGEEGYFRIKRGNNECGIEGQVTASANDAVWSKKN